VRGPQLNIRGLTAEEIRQFDDARKGIGPEGSDVTRKIFLKMLLRVWKATQVRRSGAERERLGEAVVIETQADVEAFRQLGGKATRRTRKKGTGG